MGEDWIPWKSGSLKWVTSRGGLGANRNHFPGKPGEVRKKVADNVKSMKRKTNKDKQTRKQEDEMRGRGEEIAD